MTETYDQIVFGGGSSGAAAAAGLVRGGRKVLLLEAGHSHRHPLLDMPPGIFKMINGSKFMRYHRTTPQEHLDGRVHDIPQGHVLGGGSSVNAQVYMRGRPSDYEAWDDVLRGNNAGVGWGWNDVLPFFRGMENNNRLADDLHGTEGPVQVSDPGHINEMSRWFVQAVQQLGEPYNTDFNGAHQRGVGFYQFTNHAGRRSSSAYAFLAPLEKDTGLTVRLHAEVSSVIFENDRAVGIRYADKTGERVARADGDIVLAAGALVTPK
ncbi:MAG: GMC family oxidoreductase, partial [Pseudomonadota bacterium]